MSGRIVAALIFVIGGLSAGYFWSMFNDPVPTSQQTTPGVVSEPRSSTTPTEQHTQPATSLASRTPSSVPSVATLAETASISSEFLQSAALYQLAAPLDATGIRQLLEDAKTVLDTVDYQGATALLIGRYAELDFAAALDYALSADGQSQMSWLRAIFHARARIDVDGALVEAQQLKKNQQQLIGVAMLRSTSGLSVSQRRSIIDSLNIPDHMALTVQPQAEDRWQQAKDIAEPMQRASAQARVLMSWAQTDPWAAIEASEQIKSDIMLQGVQSQLLAIAADDDTQRALDWLDSQPPGRRSDQLRSALIANIGATDLALAETMLSSLPANQRMGAELALWIQRAPSDPSGAAAWVADLPENDNFASGNLGGFGASAQMLSILGMTSPKAADRFMAALPAKKRDQLGTVYVQALAQHSPQEASRWIEQQARAATPELFQELGSNWARADVTAAQEYAESMRPGTDRDQMYSGILSSGNVSLDNVDAMLENIDDKQLRDRAKTTQTLIQRAMSLQGSASSAFIQEAN